jgi:uncharacterized protein YaiE (UPF0345 family)
MGFVMSEFKQVTVVKKANIYFDGRVTSRTIRFADGSTKTLGVMLPGDYEFNTDAGEIMEILEGDLEILLKDDDTWQTIAAGQSFEVPAHSSFKLKIHAVTDYCCSFLA